MQEKEETQKKKVPHEGADVIKLWRDEEGKLWLDDAELGPGPTFDMLNWAQLTVQMPFFYREMVGELMKTMTLARAQLARAMEVHEVKYHGRKPSPSPNDTANSPAAPATDRPVGKAVGTVTPGDTD